MRIFIVDIRFLDPGKNYHFVCEADDLQHALEQAAAAEPDYNEIVESEPIVYRRWFQKSVRELHREP